MKNIIFIISLFLISCGSDPINKEYIKAPKDISKLVFSEYDSLQIHNWHFKDIIQDSLPGISLTRLYDEIIKNKKGKKIIVAVLDTEIDIEHPALKDHIWENPNETLNNIDDDGNGFVDDINGWNFLGGKNKTNTFYQKFDYTRIVNKLATHPSIISKDTISKIYKHYSKAHDKYIDELNNINYIIEKGNVIIEKYKNQLAHPLLPLEKNITIELLDSLIENHGLKKKEINLVYLFTEFGENFKDLQNDSIRYSDKIKYQLNLDYNDRKAVGDNPYDFTDTIYGNRFVHLNNKKLYHSTLVSGTILMNPKRKNTFIKILPLCIALPGDNGDEYDKDYYLSIKYAVNNGAKVINISTSKEFSFESKWIRKAIEYAEDHEVLIVTSASNNSKIIDEHENRIYPNDIDENGVPFSDNLIIVGASSYHLDNKLKSSFSNYGKKQVDIFAPGEHIYTTSANSVSGYKYTGGTSFASPLVAKIAAILFSHYPELTVSQVKSCILESGISYNLPTYKTKKRDSTNLIPFDQLSKTGKIANAYNAFIKADSISKAK